MSNPLTIKGNWDNFDTQYYYSQYPDLQAACKHLNDADRHEWLLSHFYNNGFSERRRWRLKTYDNKTNSDSDDDSECECCNNENKGNRGIHYSPERGVHYRADNNDKLRRNDKKKFNTGDMLNDSKVESPTDFNEKKYKQIKGYRKKQKECELQRKLKEMSHTIPENKPTRCDKICCRDKYNNYRLY